MSRSGVTGRHGGLKSPWAIRPVRDGDIALPGESLRRRGGCDHVGHVAQAGERPVCNREAAGSNPAGSTKVMRQGVLYG